MFASTSSFGASSSGFSGAGASGVSGSFSFSERSGFLCFAMFL